MNGKEIIVLAGGLGTRLRPVVNDVPKPLAPVAGRPFLMWQLDFLAQQGVERVILATGYMATMIEEVIGSRYREMEVLYSVEHEPLGTGGAIARAAKLVRGDGVHVANGDTFLRYSLSSLEQAVRDSEEFDIGLALAHVADVRRYGAVTLHGQRVSSFREKGEAGPGWINAGCYFLKAAVVQCLPTGAFSFEKEVLQRASYGGRVLALENTSDFIDIGAPGDYHHAQKLFRGRV